MTYLKKVYVPSTLLFKGLGSVRLFFFFLKKLIIVLSKYALIDQKNHEKKL